MKVLYRESFLKDVEGLHDSALKKRIQAAIVEVKQAATRRDIGGVKKLEGGKSSYRIRIGVYRVGFVLEEDTVVFVRCLHRKDIYRHFP
ncbi:MAG: type II toxin-antitoxin system RelE/ParE family toxin [Planctomycetes bacterium]|nr:type II toxin-antitoxin system RelE/ParE family toxin [Planctomycetota bacterium]